MSRHRRARKPRQVRKDAAARTGSGLAEDGAANDALGAGKTAFLGPAVIAVTSFLMICWTWMTWPDVLVDFGREIYVAWRLTRGDTLYTDLVYYLGPLSPYINSLWLRLFGEKLIVLAMGNLVVWTAILVVLYRLLRNVADRFATTVACLVFVLLFSFSQYVPIGNYNYACPYSHEATHGLALSLGALWCWSTFIKRGRLGFVVAAGFVWGLSFLTRLEPFVATGAALAVGLAVYYILMKPTPRRLATIAVVLAASALVPLLLSVAVLSSVIPTGEAVRGTFGSILSVFSTSAMSQKFYRDGMGLTNPGERLASIACWSAGYLGVLVVAAGAAVLIRRGAVAARWTVSVLVSIVLVTVIWHIIAPSNQTILLPAVFRPLPVVIGSLGVMAAVRVWRMRHQTGGCDRAVFVLPLIIFAALMLGKMLLNPRIFHYGFTLAMPATVLVVVALLDWIPRILDSLGAFGQGFRLSAVAVIGVVVVAHLSIVSNSVDAKTSTVGTGENTFRADWRGEFANAALALIEKHIKPDQTLSVLPEGVMLNFLSDRENPVPYTTYGSVELDIFGEDNVLASFQAHPPDFVMIVHQDGSEFGYRFFGKDYGRKFGSWITAGYRSIQLIGAPPLQDNRFGIMLLERKR